MKPTNLPPLPRAPAARHRWLARAYLAGVSPQEARQAFGPGAISARHFARALEQERRRVTTVSQSQKCTIRYTRANTAEPRRK